MVVRTCNCCLREFTKKSSYDNHINKKNKCILHSSLVERDNDNALILNNILNELKKMKDMNEILISRISSLESQKVINKTINNGDTIKTNTNTNTKHINKGTITNTINVVAFGKENMDFNINDISKLCQGNKTVPNLINYMHFNKSKPENHNVYMPNRKNKNEVFVHNGTKWMLADKKATVEQLIDKGIEYVEGKMEELSTIISQSKYNAVERAINAYNENEEDPNNEANKKITKDIELILYNNKDLIMAPKI